MKKTLIVTLSLCVLGLVVANPAYAKGKKKEKSAAPAASAPAASGSAVLAQYDADKDGTLSDSEVEALKSDYAAHKTAVLKQYDADNDGKLDDSEIATLKSGLSSGAASKKSGKQGKKK